MSPLRALEAWYARTCDGEWEHSFGVTIETLDDPGWAVRIDLAETTLAGRPFEPVRIDRAPDDWLRCAVEADVFKGHGGPGNLHEILDAFARWAEVEPRRGRASAAEAPAVGWIRAIHASGVCSSFRITAKRSAVTAHAGVPARSVRLRQISQQAAIVTPPRRARA